MIKIAISQAGKHISVLEEKSYQGLSTLLLYTAHPSSLSLSLLLLILNSSCLNYSNNIPNGLLSLFYSCAIWFPHWFQNILSKRQIWVFIFPASSPTITPITFSFYCKHGGLAIENPTSSTTFLYFPLLYTPAFLQPHLYFYSAIVFSAFIYSALMYIFSL